jgi:hypothetical protein
MDFALRHPSNNPTIDPPRQSTASRYNRTRPISRIAPLLHPSGESIPAVHAPLEQQQSRADCRASNTSHSPSHHHSTPSRLSPINSPDEIPSPVYQTVIPAFNPNHYDLSSSTICLCIPLTFKTPFSRWRRRRKSAKEFHAHDEELRQEYARLKQIESQFRGDLSPYQECRDSRDIIGQIND